MNHMNSLYIGSVRLLQTSFRPDASYFRVTFRIHYLFRDGIKEKNSANVEI